MNKELLAIEKELGQIVINLRLESLYDEPVFGYSLNAGSPAGDLFLESTKSEREFILHKLAPDLKIVEVKEGSYLILNLK